MFQKFKYLILIIKMFILINFFLNINKNLIIKINDTIAYINVKKELRKINSYFELCNNFKFILKKEIKKSNNPKISIISPVYNRERYIIKLIKSIQYQNFNDIEIIFVDDFSIDNSIKKIEEIKKNDKRIILSVYYLKIINIFMEINIEKILKNKKNKGTFICRNIGVQFSKGKYIILPDPDDILSKNILKICYNLAEKYKYEMIRFVQCIKITKMRISDLIYKKSKSIYQPELSFYIFYGNNELQIVDFFINNKFIKKSIYIKSLRILNNSYLNMYIICFEDQIINYIIHRICKSYFFLNKVGYYYIRNSISITGNQFKISKLNIKFIFIYLKILFEFSKNNKYEKDMANIFLSNMLQNYNFKNIFLKIGKKDFNKYYKKLVNKYLKNKFISNENKYLLNYKKYDFKF